MRFVASVVLTLGIVTAGFLMSESLSEVGE